MHSCIHPPHKAQIIAPPEEQSTPNEALNCMATSDVRRHTHAMFKPDTQKTPCRNADGPP